jgi:cobyrinic acid a,c-diamide synthase
MTREDYSLSEDAVRHLAGRLTGAIDLDRLLASIPEIRLDTRPEIATAGPDNPRVRIGVARDRAFCFYYQDNLDLLAASGADLVAFSPIDDVDIPPDLAGMYLGGGYPELFAEQLETNRSMRDQIRAASRAGMPLYAECGGFMYLGTGIEDQTGRSHTMAGCLPVDTRMLSRRRSLGYRQVTLQGQTLLGGPGEVLRGHEFHYSDISGISESVGRVYRIADRDGQQAQLEGYTVHNTLGSYVHLHFGSHPQAAENFVQCCRRYLRQRREQ